MAGYLGLFAAGFRRQSTYRWALFIGVLANIFFGVFRSAVFFALYRQRERAGGLELADALTYVWVVQALFGVIFVPWLWEYPDSVRSGDFVVDLLRPGDPLGRMLAVDMGRSTFVLLTRGLPQLLVPALFLDLRLPTTVFGWGMLVVSLLLCAVAAFGTRFLLGSTAFWTADYRGWWSIFFVSLWLAGGFTVPVEFFPGALRWFAEYGPLATLLAMPVRVATGRDALASLVLQALWVAVIAVACKAVMTTAERRLVVHGG